MSQQTITLRPITPGDEAFLSLVYAQTREHEMRFLDWNNEEKDAFLQMQFKTQHQYYQTHFPDADYDIILVDGCPAGRLYVDHGEDEIRILDISLLAEFRGQKIGSKLLQDILATARPSSLPVRLHVEYDNPAVSLYKRLGFQAISENGPYIFMERLPD